MMHLEIGGERYPMAAGETVIGSAPGSAIVLEGEGVQPRHAVVQGTAAGRRRHPGGSGRGGGEGQRRSPGRRSHPGAARRQDRRSGSTSSWRWIRRRGGQHPAVRLRRLCRPGAPPPGHKPPAGHHRRPAGLSHRRPGVHRGSGAALVFGRDAGSDVVVTGQRRVAAPCRDPVDPRGLCAGGPQRQRHLRQRRADRDDRTCWPEPT